MFKKPLNTIILISGASFVFTFSLLLLLSEKEVWQLFLGAFSASALLFVLTQLILKKFIYKRIKVLFNKVLNISYDQKALKISEDPIAELVDKVNSFLERKEAEVEELTLQQQFRREYVGNIAHELKTPIFTIQGFVLTLLDGGLEDKRINRDYLVRADRSIERIIGLLDSLDLITKLDAGEFPLEVETFDVIQLCHEVYDSLELSAKKRNISLNTFGFPKHQIFVDADRGKMFQVISNLVVNAIKYGENNGSVTIDINRMSEEYLLVEVIDDGLGISEDNLLRIFERFYRVDKSGGRQLGGSGLGLSIVKHIVEAHDQTLNVKSVLGKGSTFSFTLKLS
jgi:two-component system phosphate regulon sensor histidine kinase PhoR